MSTPPGKILCGLTGGQSVLNPECLHEDMRIIDHDPCRARRAGGLHHDSNTCGFAASGVAIVKTEIENDYHHGHVEMPNPIPADARLWIEIETLAGERLKGSVPVQ